MSPGLVRALLSLVTAVGNLAAYCPKMTENRAALKQRAERTLVGLVLLLAIAVVALHPGILGTALSGFASVPASLLLLATAKSGPAQPSAVSAGEMAPDFRALDSSSRGFHLSELRGRPVLLKFYRGYWCPYCVAELDQLNRYAAEFDALGVKLIAVSSDRPNELRVLEKKHNWAIKLLADPDLAAHRRYNVQHRNFAPRREPFREIAIPTTILIDADGQVLLLEPTRDFRIRPQAQTILAKARSLLAGSDTA